MNHLDLSKFKRKLLCVAIAACFGAARANPVGPTVVAGQATFQQQGNVFSITNAPNTILNWQSFNIQPHEITRFIQQSADSKVLNRITGQDPSQILGALQSNGKVFLINPNGVVFGKEARVDVQGLVASSLALSDADFLAGRQRFSAGGGGAGKVENQGSISTAAGGQVLLLGSSVANSGVITSPQGEVLLAAGHTVQLVDAADPSLQVVVSAPADQALNLGQVLAAGGKVGIYGALVNQRGRISADSAARGADGKIVLKASRDALLEQGSVTSAANSAGKGGNIELLGERVGLTGDALVDASGASGGGQVLIGGGYQGKDAAVPNAQQTALGAQSVVRADALEQGDGGRIIAWGNQATRVLGRLSARGGARGGNGGFIETSGAYLDMRGHADLLAPAGKNGTLLLDPTNLAIVESGGLISDLVSGIFADLTNSPTSTITATTLTDYLKVGTNVEVRTASTNSGAGTLSVLTPIVWNGAATLTLTADSSMSIEAAITASDPGAALVMKAGGDLSQTSAGAISVASVTAESTGGAIRLAETGNSISNLSLKAQNGINVRTTNSATDVSKAISTAGSISFDSSGALTLSGPVEATQGTAYAYGAQGVNVSGSGIKTGGYIDLDTSAGGAIEVASGATLNSNGGSVDLTADKLNVAGTIEAGSGTIRVAARSTSQPVYLGVSDAGALSLSASTLANLHTSGDLQITSGSTLQAGGNIDLSAPSVVTLNASGDMTLDGTFKTAGSLNLYTASSGTARITHGSGASTTVGGEFRMSMGKLTLGGNVYAGSVDIQTGNSITIGSAGGTEAPNMMVLAPASLNGTLHTDILSLSAEAGEAYSLVEGGTNIKLNQAFTWAGDLQLRASNRLDVSADLAVGGGLWLAGGTWEQSGETLPALLANDFRLYGGSFLRVKGGDGTATSPYQIADVFGLQGMTTLDNTAHYRLANNIDASGTATWNAGNGFAPIGYSDLPFNGVFDGNNKSISGLMISSREQSDVGLFGRIGSATISDLTISGSVSGGTRTGALAGYAQADASISNVHSSASVFGYGSAGGLLGVSYAAISDASSSGEVLARTAGDGGAASAGGVVGQNFNTISGSSASGSVRAVTASGSAFAGGLAGINEASVSDSHASGAVSASGTSDGGAGGLAGQNTAAIMTSYATGAVSSDGQRAGGLVGHNRDSGASVTISYASGAVSGGGKVGGLVGFNEGGHVADAYATGAVTGEAVGGTPYAGVGGFVGANSGTIERGFSSGSVAASGFSDVHGFAGSNSGSVSYAYWNTSASSGLGIDSSATGRSEQEMLKEASFDGFGFGGTPVWRIYDGYTTPMLKSMLVPLNVAVTGANLNHVYDRSTPLFTGTADYSGFTGGDTVASLGGTLGWGNAVNAGSYSTGGLYSTKYDINISGGPVLTITPREISLSATKGYDGTAAIGAGQLVFGNMVAGDSLSFSGTVAFADKNAGSGKTLVLGQGGLAGDSAANYTLNLNGASGAITPAQLSVSGLLAPDRAYNGQLAASTSGGTLVGVVSGDNVQLGSVSASFGSVAPGVNKEVIVSQVTLSGTDAGNYSVLLPSNLTATITQAPLATWVGPANGVWSDSANWAGGVVPVYDYVLSAVLGGGSGSVAFSGGEVTLKTLTATNGQTLLVQGGKLTLGSSLADVSALGALALGGSGTLELNGTLNGGSFTQASNASTLGAGALNAQYFNISGGTLSGLSSLQATSAFTQTGGTIAMPGSVSLAQAEGNLQVGALSAGVVTLRADNGGITQTAALEATALSATARNDVVLNNSANHVRAFSGSGAGISLVNALSGDEQLGLGTLSATGGDLTVDNVGGIYTEGVLSAPGKVSLTAHSPVTVNNAIRAGSIALTASSDIALGSGAVLDASGTIGLNAGSSVQLGGSMSNTSGNISATADTGNVSASSGTTINNGGQVLLTARLGSVSTAGLTIANGAAVVTDLASLDAAAKAAAEAAAKAAAEAAAKAAAEAAAKAAAEAAAKAAAEAAAKAAAEAAAKAAAEAAAKAAAEEAAAKAAAEAAAKKAAEEAAAKAAAEAAAKKAAEEAAAKAAAEAAAKKAAEEAAAKAAAEAAAKKAAEEAAAKAAAEAAAKAAADAAAKAAAEAAAKAAAEAAAKKAAEEAAAKAAAEAQNRPGEPVSQAVNSTVNIINTSTKVVDANPASTASSTPGDDADREKQEEKVASSQAKDSKLQDSVKKMYCN